jgi:sulfonate transport system substrate-binding protein
MASRRVGMLALALLGASGALSVYGAVRGPVDLSGSPRPAHTLTLDAPLPTRIPPGTKLVIGDPTAEQVLKHTGWLKDLPFQIQWAEIAGGPAVTEAFHAKALDVGSGANIPPIHAVWVGMPVKMIAVRFREDPLTHPSFVLAVAPKAKIATLADLRGKRIAYSPGQVQGEIVIRTLRSQGLSPADVKLVELPSTSADVYINALLGGAIDVAPLGAGPPVKRYIERFGQDGAHILRHSPEPDDLVTLYVRDETLADPAKAAALRAYVKLWGRVQEWINQHPEEWAQTYYVAHEGLSPENARYAVEASGKSVVPARWDEAIARQQASIDLMAQTTHHAPFAAAQLFDRRFESIAAEGVAELRATPTCSSPPAEDPP